MELFFNMIECEAEKDYRRHETVKEAVIAADRIIMEGSDGSEMETNYLTASVAIELMRIAFLPFKLEISFFKHPAVPKRDIIMISVEAARKTIKDSRFTSEEEANYLIAEVAREFAVKSLRPFQIMMLREDLKLRAKREEGYSAQVTSVGDR